MGVITISLGARLNDAGVIRFFSGVKEFQKISGVSSNFSEVSKKKMGGCVTGGCWERSVMVQILG